MPPAPPPAEERARLAALRPYQDIDAACGTALDNLLRLATRLTGSPIGLVSLVGEERQSFPARRGVELEGTPREQSFCAHAILQPDRPLVVPDARRDPRFADNPLVTGEPGIRAYAGVPLVTPEGHALGTLCVIDRRPRRLGRAALETLTDLARSAEAMLELSRLMHQLREKAMADPQTGLVNRAAFLRALGAAIARQQRDGLPFSVLAIALDGPPAGEGLLRSAARILGQHLRQGDLLARIDGQGFAALLLGGDGSEVSLVAERLRAAALGIPASISIGGACFLDPPEDEDAALAAATRLMHCARAAGGNRVRCAEHLRPPATEVPVRG